MRNLKLLLLAATATAAAPSWAEDAPDTLVVTANRTATPLSEVGVSISVIDAGEIATRQTEIVADLLRTVPGVSIAGNGGIGSLTSVFIRGAQSDQTVALIDGVKINNPSSPGGGFDFGNLLVGNIARIEVLRGPSSVLWGSQAIGGVVNLITAPPTETLAINGRAEYGYHNTGQVVGNVSGKAGPLSASAGAGYFRTDGISAFDRRLGGAEKDGYRNYGANANLNLALSDAVSIDARGYYSNGKVDLDGFTPSFAFGDTNQYGKTRELVGYTGLNAALFDGRFRNRFGFAYTDTDRHDYDRDGGPDATFTGNGRNERYEYQGVFDIAKVAQATFGAEREDSHFTTSSFGGPKTRGAAHLTSGYGQLVVTPFAGFTATGGVRYDHHNEFGGATTFSGSGVYTPNAGNTEFRASYSEGFKAPTLYQLQGDYGNEALRPERAKGWDAGITQRVVEGRIEASATYFHRTSHDLIDFVSCDDDVGICFDRPNGTYDNVSRAVSKGVETTLAVRPVEALTLRVAYTWLDARDRSDGSANEGNRLSRRPSQSINTLIDYKWPFGLTTGATIVAVGSSYDNAANTRKLEGYTLVDLRAAMPVTKNIEVYGRIENLFDAHYETAFQYGTPGRGAFAGVRLKY